MTTATEISTRVHLRQPFGEDGETECGTWANYDTEITNTYRDADCLACLRSRLLDLQDIADDAYVLRETLRTFLDGGRIAPRTTR